MNIVALVLVLGALPVRDLDQNFSSEVWQQNIRRGRLPYHKLTQRDFREVEKSRVEEAANTASFIEFRFSAQISGRTSYQAKIVQIKVWSGFDKNASGRRKGLTMTPELLAHEQLHLDINELYAHRFANTRLSDFPVGSGVSSQRAGDDLQRRMKKYFEELRRSVQNEQDRYDAETDHGLNESAQDKWARKIGERLRDAGIKAKWSPE